MERMILLLEELGRLPADINRQVDVYIAVIGEGVRQQALLLAAELRQGLPGLRILTHCGGGKYNSQLKKAFTSGARCALVLEGSEAQSELKFRVLNDEGATTTLALDAVQEQLLAFFD